MPRTLNRIFLDSVSRESDETRFLHKVAGVWQPISAGRARGDVESFALGLRELGIRRGDHVAILAENRYEWAVADLAILGLGAVSVPLYPTQTSTQVGALLADSEARAIVVSTAEQRDKVTAVAASLPRLEVVIPMDEMPVRGARERSWNAVAGRGAIARGSDPLLFRETADSVGPDDLATIIYTSGTTGEPKGAMLTHGNIASDVDACLEVIDLRPTDVSLSFLPLSHIFERMAGQFAMLARGVTIAYAESVDTVAANALEVRPTILTAVPRFYEKVHGRVMDAASSMPPLRRRIFDWGLAKGRERARAHFQGRKLDSLTHTLADRLVGAPIRARVGGRLRFGISGGAPLAPEVMEFFFAVGIPIVEGYGLTETSPVICLNRLGDERPGSVGPPIPGVEVKIAEDGEVVTRGPHVMRGYFRNEKATAEALRGGWFHTGDVGRIDEEGRLWITDRLKDLIVLAGGKKVAPQPLEAKLKQSRWITEAVLIGDRRPYVTCLVVPAFAALQTRTGGDATRNGHAELVSRPEVRALIQTEIDRLNAEHAPFEQIKRFEILDRELTIENGELTPTLKVRRRVIAEAFRDAIERMYAGHASPAAA